MSRETGTSENQSDVTIYTDYSTDNNKNIITISLKKSITDPIATMIHELGHHVDKLEKISDNKSILGEHQKKKRQEPHKDDPCEYIAYGFERFYLSGKRKEGYFKGGSKKFKRENPELYNTIETLHEKYSQL